VNTKAYKGIWVFAEQRNGELHEVSLELLGKARELADQANSIVIAVLLGHKIKFLAQTLINYGADSVIVVDAPELSH
jgi:electron transfer flavoprotein alpha subunit